MQPLIGITTDIVEVEGRERCAMYPSYARAVLAAGGTPVLLGHDIPAIDSLIARLDGFILTGGDDPIMEDFGVPTDPRVTPLHPDRQAFEMALLRRLEDHPAKPVLGVCLGMQLMALNAGGTLDQYMPDRGDEAALHWEHEHAIVGADGWPFGDGPVLSRHKQAVIDGGEMEVIATAPDGVVEAIEDERLPFYIGVQWHPERTKNPGCGADIFAAFISAAS